MNPHQPSTADRQRTAACRRVSEADLSQFCRPPDISFSMIDSGIFAMNSIFNDVCVLVTIAFALTLAPGFNRAGLSFLSRRDQATALVENAVQHGLRSSPQAGRLCLVVRPAGPWLELSVSDDGKGVPSTEVEHIFFAERPRVHALVLLRRRLQTLLGCSFQLEVRSEIGEGTTVTMRIPLLNAADLSCSKWSLIGSSRD
jgi:Histidine kinase-, DNA gyrase B-, and HSP90-like ATPase